MKIRELAVHLDHPMLNLVWHVRPFPSTTTTTIAPAERIRGIAGNTRQHLQHRAFIVLVYLCRFIPCCIPDMDPKLAP
jgi:hypothetical protein